MNSSSPKFKRAATEAGEPRLRRVQPLLGTFVEISLWGGADEPQLQAWITEGFAAVTQVDKLMSVHHPESDVSRLNRARAQTWVSIDPLTRKVLQASNDLFKTSGGIFDIRCRSLNKKERLQPPVEMDGLRARKCGSWTIDLGGIAKGFAVDQAVERIQQISSGSSLSGVVNAGGDLRTWGKKDSPLGLCISDKQFSLGEVGPLAAATSSVRDSQNAERLTAAAHRQMPNARLLHESKTVAVFAERCLFADALTKVILMGSQRVADRCLTAYQAGALIFNSNGQLMRALT